ncbi:MAG: hypothetical protein JW715_03510 [Sedimentisphaerales bacterium]|nr:hypothetical protein [Sedimentisphaerales bacterium]
MNLEYLKEKKEYVSMVLLGLSVLMGVFMVYTVTDFFADTARAENIISTAMEQINTESKNVDQYFTEDREIAGTLTRKNLFVPQAEAENPVQEVRAIFGNQVLINDRWYGEGDTIPGNATVVSIEATHVEIEWNGIRNTLRPIDASIPQTQQSERTVARGTGRESPDMVVIGSQSGQFQDRRGTLDNLRQRFQNMSDAERTRLRNEMRQQFGGGFGDRGGGMFGGGRGNFGGGRGGRGGGGGRGGR